MPEPLARNFDYLGRERLAGYVRGVNAVRCPECKATGVIEDASRALPGDQLYCPTCGGYGDISPQQQSTTKADEDELPIVDLIAGAVLLDSL